MDAITRNPMFLFLLFGLFLFRAAHRAFLLLLLKAPPRNEQLPLGLPLKIDAKILSPHRPPGAERKITALQTFYNNLRVSVSPRFIE